MNAPAVRSVEVNGFACRVWEKGDGEPIGVLAGIGGFQRWTPFLEALSQSRRVVVPSLPGFPGGEGHEVLDTQLDWLLATHDLLTAADLTGTDLVGVSGGAALAAALGEVPRERQGKQYDGHPVAQQRAQLAGAQAVDVLAVHQDAAAGVLDQAVEHAHQRGLARAR